MKAPKLASSSLEGDLLEDAMQLLLTSEPVNVTKFSLLALYPLEDGVPEGCLDLRLDSELVNLEGFDTTLITIKLDDRAFSSSFDGASILRVHHCGFLFCF